MTTFARFSTPKVVVKNLENRTYQWLPPGIPGDGRTMEAAAVIHAEELTKLLLWAIELDAVEQ